MAEEKKTFDLNTLKIVLEKEIEARSAKYFSDQALSSHQKSENSSIARYINAYEIENIIEGIISKLGGSSLELGMVFVSVKDKNNAFVTADSDCDKIIVSVAYGQQFIIKNREYPLQDNGAETTKPSPASKQTESKIPASEVSRPGAVPDDVSKPAAASDGTTANKAAPADNHEKVKQIQLLKEFKRKLDELWANRKGLGVDFNNPGALKIELMQDSPRISKMMQEIGKEVLDIRIDRKAGLIIVHTGGKVGLKWKFPEDKNDGAATDANAGDD